MVDAEEAQTEALRTDHRGDYWGPITANFRDDPRREGDALVEALAGLVDADSTVLDVGAGAGRLALPLALRCRGVVAVEPSEAMCHAFSEQAAQHGIENYDLVQSSWEDARVEPADLAFAAHVVYVIRAVGEFIDKLAAHATGTAALVVTHRAPVSQFDQWWSAVHGVERLPLPALPELLDLLWERGVYPNVRMLPSYEPAGFKDEGEAFSALRHRLFIGSEQSESGERLRRAIPELLKPSERGLVLKKPHVHQLALVHWPVGG
ncbi:MAG: methyltransferase domain-containing protein [Dehalococcoidia bacterium]|nr:methyltransferase domain-containing protein [Dehalococcoidia bacterium]